jgi:hypothetical protein
MVKYWTKFARSKKPKVSKAPKWHAYQTTDLTSQRLISLVPPAPTDEFGISFGADHQCSFWDPLIGN